ncbi:MAG: response regulator [Bacteroidetes bacterium]|nr:response regulator [Bacteroidota bacterium]
MKYIQLFYIFFLLILLVENSHTQNQSIRFATLDVDDGLSNNFVTCSAEDSLGFLWFGTKDGLNRYDGYSFKKYFHDKDGTNTLSDNFVTSLIVTDNGTLWIGTAAGGVCSFDLRYEKFVSYSHHSDSAGTIDDNRINFIMKDSDPQSKILWIGTVKGLNKFDVNSRKFKKYLLPRDDENKFEDIGVKVIHKDNSGLIWIGTDFGLYTFDEKAERWQRFVYNPNDVTSISSNKVTSISSDSFGSLYIGTLDGLNKVEQISAKDSRSGVSSFSFVRLGEGATKGFRGKPILSISEDRERNLWVGTYHGVNKINSERNGACYYNHDEKDNLSLAGNIINTIMQNKSGMIWFGTGGNGISQFYPRWSAFQHIRHIPGLANSISGKSARGIYVDDDGILWAGGYSGLNKINRETGKFEQLIPTNSEITTELVFAISPDRKNKDILWLGSEGGGLIKFNKRTGKTKTFTSANYTPGFLRGAAPSDNFIFDIHCDRNGILLLATRNGLNEFNPYSEIFTYYLNSNLDAASISSNQLRVICEDAAGRIWIGTEANGVDVYNRDSGTFKRIGYGTDGKRKLGSNRIYSIIQDSKGFIWVGTSGGGLTKIDCSDESNPVFKNYTTKDGLPNNIIYGIIEDENNNLWLSTNLGISKFNTVEITFKNYNQGDGLQSNEFNSGSYFKSKNGEMFFGGINGLNTFFPGDIKESDYFPPVVITDLKLFNKSVVNGLTNGGRLILPQSISYTNEIELLYSDNVITFEFAALGYSAQPQKMYAYKLIGFDEVWNHTTASLRVAHYTNIHPGEYTLKIILDNQNESTNEKGVSLKLIILPPWWNTWLAWCTYVILFFGAVYYIRKYEMARLSLKNKLKLEAHRSANLAELDRMKTVFFTNISHEIKTPLSLLVGPIDKLIELRLGKKPTHVLQIMKKNTLRMNNIIDQILQISKLENKAVVLRVSRRDIISDLNEIISMFSSQSEGQHITIKLHTEKSSINLFYNIDMIEKIFSNLISNSIKFTPRGGKINVHVDVDKSENDIFRRGCIKISVKDNGCGIEKEKLNHIFNRFYQAHLSGYKVTKGIGIGLAYAKELVQLHSGTIEVFSVEKEGAEFVVSLPLGSDHFLPEQFESEAIDSNANFVEPPHPESHIDLETVDEEELADEYETIILIIDDNPDMLSYLKSILIDKYKVIEAANGKTGLAKAIEYLPDLIITDIKMPEMDGIDLCNVLKKEERTSHIPVIMLTAKTTVQERIKGLKVGADAYIPKPFNSTELEVRVVNLIKQRRKLREKFETQQEYKIKEIAVTPADEIFLHKVLDSIETHLSDIHFNVEEFRNELGFSKVQFIRKIKSLTGKSPNQFLRNYRLQRAAQLIKQDFGSISEIAYKVGFDNLNYFAKCFKEQFGCTASEYKKNLG